MPTQKRLTPLTARSDDSACLFAFADGRRCRMPRFAGGHSYLCAYHARKESQTLSGDQLGRELAQHFSGSYLSAHDLTAALGRLFAAVAQGRVKPKTAATLAYLSQTLVQTVQLAQHEHINAFGSDSWRRTLRSSLSSPPDATPPHSAPSV